MHKNRLHLDFIDIASIILVLTLIAAGQITAKIGAGISGRVFLELNGYLIASYAVFLARGVIWSLVLRRHPVSRVYPLLALSYPLILIISLMFFDEPPGAGKVMGSLLILAGAALMVPGEKT